MADKKEIGGTVILIGALALVGAGYYFLVYKKKDTNNSNDAYNQFDNFKNLQTNIGLKAGAKSNVVIAPFNEKKNYAQFYDNNRVIIFNEANQIMVKGTYSNGGFTITLDNGKILDSGSVWKNIIDAIK